MEKTKIFLGLGLIALGGYLFTKKDTPSPKEKQDYVPNKLIGGGLAAYGIYLTYKSLK